MAKKLKPINSKYKFEYLVPKPVVTGNYIGTYIEGDLAGVKVSNPSYKQYYKDILNGPTRNRS